MPVTVLGKSFGVSHSLITLATVAVLLHRESFRIERIWLCVCDVRHLSVRRDPALSDTLCPVPLATNRFSIT